MLVCASARAQSDTSEVPPTSIAGIAVGPTDAAVLDQLDTMLDRPTVRRPPNGARTRDDYVVLATSLSERFVVVVDVRRSRVYAFEPRAQRVVDRAIPRDVVRSPYAVAGIAFELLELIGFESAEPPPDPDPPPNPDPPPDPVDRETPPPATPAPAPLFDGIEFGVGVRGTFGLTDEPRYVQLTGGVDVVLAPWASERRLVLGVFGAGLGTEGAHSEQGSNIADLTYRRTDLGVRVGLGRRLADHLSLAGFVVAGVGLGAIDVSRTNGGGNASTERDRWASGLLGLGIDLGLPIRGGFSFAVRAAIDTLLVAHDYSGAANSELHESPVRFTACATFGWGTSSLGRGRRVHQ